MVLFLSVAICTPVHSRGRGTVERRTLLKLMTSAAGATLALGSGTLTVLLPARRAEGKSVGKTLAKFVDPLPILSVISPSAYVNRTPLYKVTMQQFKQKL